jgi:nucleolar MIF4G domain-containing protein 1
MHCCAQERVFNPFYAHLAAKLCSFDYNYKFTLQYAFWDKFKQLPSLPVRTISNLGILLAHLIANFSLSLSVLKVRDRTRTTVHAPPHTPTRTRTNTTAHANAHA